MLILLAVLPGVVLFDAVRRQDKIEKEPMGLLVSLFLGGALTTLSAMLFGWLGGILLLDSLDPESMEYLIIDNFLVTALVEEGGKYFVLKHKTWRHPAFNYTFDAVVYAVTAALGFAVAENILYVMDGGVGVALLRAAVAVPGHAFDGVFMGYYYGIAKTAQLDGDKRAMRGALRKALWVPVVLHGFYDFCLATESDAFLLVFIVFDIALTVFAVRRIRKSSRTDAPV